MVGLIIGFFIVCGLIGWQMGGDYKPPIIKNNKH